jgi:Zn ribbon nucleic-acid-binding protein
MKNHDYASLATKCFECGRNKFLLTRMEEGQVLAECVYCGHSHTLDSVLEKKTRAPLIYWFSAPKKMERCVDCRSPLKVWDISYDGNLAHSQCSKCGLYHTFKKTRLRGWRLLRVTRCVGDGIMDVNPVLDLTEIKGIGRKRAEVLGRAGVKSISKLANSSVFVLSSKTGISEKFLFRWIKQAKEFAH